MRLLTSIACLSSQRAKPRSWVSGAARESLILLLHVPHCCAASHHPLHVHAAVHSTWGWVLSAGCSRAIGSASMLLDAASESCRLVKRQHATNVTAGAAQASNRQGTSRCCTSTHKQDVGPLKRPFSDMLTNQVALLRSWVAVHGKVLQQQYCSVRILPVLDACCCGVSANLHTTHKLCLRISGRQRTSMGASRLFG